MFRRIMVAVDIDRPENAAAAAAAAARLAKHEKGEVHFVSIRAEDSGEPSEEFKARLQAYAQRQQEQSGAPCSWLAILDDPVDEGLEDAVEHLEADLVVMGPHEPRWHELLTGPDIRDFVTRAQVSVLIAR